MDLNNVAMIMAPNLFLSTGNKSGVSLREVEMAKGTINIVRMLIKYHSILWTVSVLVQAFSRSLKWCCHQFFLVS